MPVTDNHPLYLDAVNEWELVRDTMKGEKAVKRAGKKYLPKAAGKSREEYAAYMSRVKFKSFVRRTADGLHGEIFKKPPLITGDESELFKELIQNVNLEGDSLEQFAADCCWDCMQTNWGGILVDYTKSAAMNKLEAESSGGRAYMKWYKAENVINWDYDTKRGAPRLSLVVLCEYENIADDEFSHVYVPIYRVLKLVEGAYVQEVYKLVDGKYVLTEQPPMIMGGNVITEIPFFPCPAKVPEDSMLLDLANENISYYQLEADYRDYLHWGSLVTGIITNWQPPESMKKKDGSYKELPVGGSSFLVLNSGNDKAPDAKFLETTGSAAQQHITAMEESKSNMGVLGAHILTREQRGVETADAARIHRHGEHAVLSAFANAMSEQLSPAVCFMAKWQGIETEFKISLNTDYDFTKISEQFMSMIVNGRNTGDLPRSAVFEMWKKQGVLNEDMTIEEYLDELRKDGELPYVIQDDSFEEPI
jgi:hypothetical protein